MPEIKVQSKNECKAFTIIQERWVMSPPLLVKNIINDSIALNASTIVPTQHK